MNQRVQMRGPRGKLTGKKAQTDYLESEQKQIRDHEFDMLCIRHENQQSISTNQEARLIGREVTTEQGEHHRDLERECASDCQTNRHKKQERINATQLA